MSELLIRLAGIGLLLFCGFSGWLLGQIGEPQGPSEITLLGFGLALLTFLSFAFGMAMLIHGRALFVAAPAPHPHRHGADDAAMSGP